VTVGIYGSPNPLQQKAARIALKKRRRNEKACIFMESLAKETNDKGFHKTTRALARFAEKGRKHLQKKRGLETERECCSHPSFEESVIPSITPFSSHFRRESPA